MKRLLTVVRAGSNGWRVIRKSDGAHISSFPNRHTARRERDRLEHEHVAIITGEDTLASLRASDSDAQWIAVE